MQRISGNKELLCIKDVYMATGELAFEEGQSYFINADGSTKSKVSNSHYVTEDLIEDKHFIEVNKTELK